MFDEARIAENVRRLAGMHLVTIDSLANVIGITRPAMMRLLAVDPDKRSVPKARTAAKLAEAFGLPLSALGSQTQECLQEAVAMFDNAPIRQVANVPVSALRDSVSVRLSKQGKAETVVQLRPKGERVKK